MQLVHTWYNDEIQAKSSESNSTEATQARHRTSITEKSYEVLKLGTSSMQLSSISSWVRRGNMLTDNTSSCSPIYTIIQGIYLKTCTHCCWLQSEQP